MATLKIQPIEYKGRRLSEVGERVAATFSPLFDDFKIIEEIKLIKEVRRLRYYFGTNPWTASLPPNYKTNFEPPYNVAVGYDFPEILLKYGEPILGITSLPAVSKHYQEFWSALEPFDPNKSSGDLVGLCYCRRGEIKKSTFVSTYSPEFGEIDSESHLELLTKIAIHEVGHMYGLKHHFESLDDIKCPMIGDITGGRVTEFVASVDYLFCDRCYQSLGVPQTRI